MMKNLYKALLVSAAVFAASNANAVVTSANDKAQLNLFFGASKISQNASYIPPLPNLSLMSAKVVAPTTCNGSVSFAMSNAFTDGTIQKIYDNFDAILKQLASKEGLIYLSSLYVSKSNPALYQLITEGIDLSITDLLSSIGSCEAMANSIIENVADDTVIEMQRSTALNQIIEQNAQKAIDKDWNNISVDDVFKKGADLASQKGFTIFGQTKGGDGQPALDIVKDTFSIGWCIYRGYTKDQCRDSRARNPNLLQDKDKSTSQIIVDVTSLNYAGARLVGNSYVSICKGCSTIKVASKNVTDYMMDVQSEYENRIRDLTRKHINTITVAEFKRVSVTNSIEADANYFRNLAVLDNDPQIHAQYISGWAFDIAYFETINVLKMLEFSIKGAKSTDDIDKAGLTKEFDRMLDQVESRRRELREFSIANNYTPRMYVRALLRVSERVSKGDSPLGKSGLGL
ncbi:hypothetical protein [Vibrio sp. Evd11]|uniref:hypothetical protein n=1 Tax=Vibrio sp. Evd11 TaxID=1207404 RepID=UPI000EFABBF0|nr:hypothetical protein [Vibrio sp. Evd11]